MHDAKKVGDYEATVHFHKEVEVKVPVKVVAENAPVEAVEAPVEEAPVAEAACVWWSLCSGGRGSRS